MKMYQYLDSLLEKAKKKLRAEFNHIGVMGFDELNVINTKKVTKDMFDRLLSENEKMYHKVAKKAYGEGTRSAQAAGYGVEKETEITLDWVVGILLGYKLVTGYVYDREAERKRLRLNEQILTAREYDSRQMLNDSVRKTANLWWTQTVHYGIDMVDSATMQAYKDAGVKRVRWITEDDGRECSTCKSRHRVVYKLSEVPSKTHYGCRCHLEPVSYKE